jgi:chaperonin GroES
MAKKKTASGTRTSDVVDEYIFSGIVPTDGYLLIRPQEAETKTEGGIYLPDSAEGEKPLKGKVLAVGGDEVLENGNVRKAPCSKGDVVIYKKWGGNEVKIGGVDCLFSKFEDILAIVKK